ncbi:MAG: 30S ribosomal protein S20 [Patescibacteria group bacterium]|nr:30S ribosomal protein S20 [Patescibacteria group bacterium]
MPNKKSAKKELRKNTKRQKENNLLKNRVKDLVKKTKKEIIAQTPEAGKDINQVIRSIDKMAKKGIIKKNTASRQKSKLQKKINKLKK